MHRVFLMNGPGLRRLRSGRVGDSRRRRRRVGREFDLYGRIIHGRFLWIVFYIDNRRRYHGGREQQRQRVAHAFRRRPTQSPTSPWP